MDQGPEMGSVRALWPLARRGLDFAAPCTHHYLDNEPVQVSSVILSTICEVQLRGFRL